MAKTRKETRLKVSATASKRKSNPNPSEDKLRKMIAEAAYFKAEHRQFAPGFEELDWLEAEQEIETMLSNN
jgi:hypothetical protein